MLKIKNGGIVLGTTKNEYLNKADGDAKMVFILDGEVEDSAEEKKALSCGDGIVMRDNAVNLLEFKKSTSFVWFEFSGDVKNALTADTFTCDDTKRFEAIANALCPNGSWKTVNSSYSEMAAGLVLSLVEFAENQSSPARNHYVNMAKRYIDKNYSLPIKVEEVAESIGVDRKYLRNLFFADMGMSTKDYLMNVRIEKAKELLGTTELSVSEVAGAVGYSDALGFSKIFKKYTELSPSEFRNSDKAKTKPAKPKPVKKKEKPEKAEKAPEPKVERKREEIKYFLL